MGGADFVEAVQEFLCNASLLKQVNHTVLVLLPKSSHAPGVEDFRPISCCNVFYKVISKIIASSTVLDSLPALTAFIGGRCMSNNIHLAQELRIITGRGRLQGRCMIKAQEGL